MDFQTVVKEFNTTPFLFVGSGFSRRYYGLPDWQGLLRTFVRRLSDDEFAFHKYMNEAERDLPPDSNKLARVASLIMKDFDARWFDDVNFRKLNEKFKAFMKPGDSPFKLEVAQYIEENSNVIPAMEEELEQFKELSKRSLAGIITTNYDELLEFTTEYKRYVGQEELIFSALQGWAETYKIHGCVSSPDSIVITEQDYQKFKNECPYLAAKLMTIFMEYPIIFLGYSINDPNILLILTELGKCLSPENLRKLQNRFVYVQYEEGQKELEIFQYSIHIGNDIIHMTGVKTDNFKALYEALSEKRATFPVKLIRMFKQDFYNYALTNETTSSLRIAHIDDERIDDENLVLAIAKPSEFTLYGLRGLSAEQWYRHVVFHDLEFTADELMQYAYPTLIATSNALPLNRILAEAKEEYPEAKKKLRKTFDDNLSNTIRRTRTSLHVSDRSVKGILAARFNDRNKAILEIAYLHEHEINIKDLEEFIINCFNEKDFYKNLGNKKSDFHRLVRIYDCLKFAQK